MNHKVKLCVKIWNETRTAYFRGETDISLPFVPTLGIKLRFEGVSDTLVIKEIVWSMQENFFECFIEPDCTCVFDLGDDVQELSDALDPLKDLKKKGWSGLNEIWRGV